MGSISGFGTAFAALIAASAASATSPPLHDLTIEVTGLRNASGLVQVAICPEGAGFPKCRPGAGVTMSAPASKGTLTLRAKLPAGRYAIALFHDENSNGKLDTFLGIPREGYGFSRNPPFRPRAPRFDESVVTIAGPLRQSISLRYL